MNRRTASAQVRFNDAEIRKLDALKDEFDLDRSSMIRQLIEQAYEQLRMSSDRFEGEFVSVGLNFVARVRAKGDG